MKNKQAESKLSKMTDKELMNKYETLIVGNCNIMQVGLIAGELDKRGIQIIEENDKIEFKKVA